MTELKTHSTSDLATNQNLIPPAGTRVSTRGCVAVSPTAVPHHTGCQSEGEIDLGDCSKLLDHNL